ncbi:kinase-like domain-containing protein [Lactifluus volemus]|nr:kinase-like domain-containing protein [Lactifluus volemus]
MATESSQIQTPEHTFQPTPGISERLSSHEVKWRDRQPFLESKGYMLRPRFRPGWELKPRRLCEDFPLLPLRPLLVDATRISDGKLVYIKEVETGDLESLPILDTFVDYADESISYIVMPFLRLLDNPPFETVGEVVDFADQILEGLVFMHSHGVAHRDCSPKNVLMDASHMFPLGFHPVKDLLLPDISNPAPIIPRRHAGVKYYFIDYGISSYFPAGGSQDHQVLGLAGRDQDVPELSDEVPYDPFKVDIFTIGNVFFRKFCNDYSNLRFFRPLAVSMTQLDPTRRPTAEEALRQWRAIRGNLNFVCRNWRLWERNEPLVYSLMLDVVHVLLSIPHLIGLTSWTLS